VFCGQSSGLDGLLERLVVGFRLVGVGAGETREGPVGGNAVRSSFAIWLSKVRCHLPTGARLGWPVIP
jgi:hypothetical protein